MMPWPVVELEIVAQSLDVIQDLRGSRLIERGLSRCSVI
jgi:hypothetical protein